MGAQGLQATVAKRLEATRANTLDLRRYRSYSLEAKGQTRERPYERRPSAKALCETGTPCARAISVTMKNCLMPMPSLSISSEHLPMEAASKDPT